MGNTSDTWHIPQYPTRKHCITSIYQTPPSQNSLNVYMVKPDPKIQTWQAALGSRRILNSKYNEQVNEMH